MKRLVLVTCLAMAGWSGVSITAHPALAASLCVGGPGCYTGIQAAIDHANAGDVITIGPGSWAGGITIDKSVLLVGAGAKATIINGGGPVLTIGHSGPPPEPTVSVSGVTITGGSNSTDPTSFKPVGGGILVPASTSGSICNGNDPLECRGATVTITDSTITRNQVVATATMSCGDGCTFSLPLGGGIANFGVMTLTNTTVSNNTAFDQVNPEPFFPLTVGGGIETTGVATLTLHSSTVSNNVASVTTNSPCAHGFGGGINTDGQVTMDGSTVSGNSIILSNVSTDPTCEVQGIGGGMRLTQSASVTVRGSVISGNSVTTTGSSAYGGFVNSAAGAIDDDGSIVLQDSTVSNNRATTTVNSTQPSASALSDAGAMEIDGAATIKNTKFIENSAVATSPAGADSGSPSSVGGALVVTTLEPVTLTESVVSGNSVRATTTSGTAFALGGGIFNCSTTLTLRDTTVTNNSGTATGPPGGAAQGGGIWNSDCGQGAPALALIDSSITSNRLTASHGIAIQGGGVFNTGTLSLKDTTIARNVPDQCFGC